MSTVLMTIGQIAFYTPSPGFDTPSFEDFTRDTQFSWTAQQRLSRSPAMQFTGPGDDVISIEGRLYPNQFGGLSTMSALRAAGNEGKPLILMRYYPLEGESGMEGRSFGRYVIKRLRQKDTKIGINGLAHRVDFTIELAAYGEDPGGETNMSSEFTFV
jgi:phage protein U